MARYVSFRDGGKTDENGIARPFQDLFNGEVKTGFVVAQQGTPAMGIQIGIGSAFIPSGNNYPYHVFSDAAENLTLNTADGSNPRYDMILAYVDLATVSSTNPNNPNALKYTKATGTPAGSPSEPNAAAMQSAVGSGNPYIILARVTVAAGASTITNANVVDRRTMAKLGVPLADDALTNAQLKTGAGEPGGIWNSWTPTMTNFTVGTGGSAGITAAYKQIGKTVFFRIQGKLGTSGMSVGGQIKFTLPVTAVAAPTSVDGTFAQGFGVVWYFDHATNLFGGGLQRISTTEVNLVVSRATDTYVQPSAATSGSVPMNWGANDSFYASGYYEAA